MTDQKRMKILIVLSAIVAAAYAQVSCLNFPGLCWRSMLKSSPQQRLPWGVVPMPRSGNTKYLNVCDAPVSKNVQRDVQSTLEKATGLLERLANAINNDDARGILNVMQDAKPIIAKKIAAIEGSVYAAIESRRVSSLDHIPNDQRQCVHRVRGELETWFEELKQVQKGTEDATKEFKQRMKFEKFNEIQQQMKDLVDQVEQFISNPTEKQRLELHCKAARLEHLMTLIMDNLNQMVPQLKQKPKEIKDNAIESAVGLMAQAINLNALCHGGQYVDESEQVQARILQEDVLNTKTFAEKIESSVNTILGRGSFFRRVFGY